MPSSPSISLEGKKEKAPDLQKDATRSLTFSQPTQIFKLSLCFPGVWTLQLPLGPLSLVKERQATVGGRGTCSSFSGALSGSPASQYHIGVSDLRAVLSPLPRSTYSLDSHLVLQGHTQPSPKTAAPESLLATHREE